MTSDTKCPFCGGAGQVAGVVDDVAFVFACICAGGSEEPVRWLLGLDREPPPGDDWTI